jgi:hypothetical protein
MAQPKVITIQPAFWALDWSSRTPATTPQPKTIRIAVPIASATMMLLTSTAGTPFTRVLDSPGDRIGDASPSGFPRPEDGARVAP